MERLRLIGLGLLALLVLIVILQNTEPVDTGLLFFTFTMPRAFWLFGTFIAGFLVGALWMMRRRGPH